MTLPKKPNSLVKERSDDSFKEAEATTGPLDTFFFIYQMRLKHFLQAQ